MNRPYRIQFLRSKTLAQILPFSFVCTLALFLPAYCLAQAGSLDMSFGDGGRVTTNFPEAPLQPTSLAVQPDEKILVVGQTVGANGNQQFGLARYHSNGTLDTSFGDSGFVKTEFVERDAWARRVVVQGDGRIVAAGYSVDWNWNSDMAVARYNADGSLDNSFGTAGRVNLDFGASSYDVLTSLLLTREGKIVVAGGTNANNSGFALARFNSDGTLDDSFGTGGLITTNPGPNASAVRGLGAVSASARQRDGKLIAAGGNSDEFPGSSDFALVRYNPDGSLDSTFGADGIVTTDFVGHADQAKSIILLPDGKIVAVGHAWSERWDSYEIALARYMPDGSLDTTFGNSGLVMTDFAGYQPSDIVGRNDTAQGAMIQSDGRIIVAGRTSAPDDIRMFWLLRYEADGSIDSTYGENGRVRSAFDDARTMVMQSDDKILVAGISRDPGDGDIDLLLARYLGPASSSSNVGENLPHSHDLDQNYPNPFRQSTDIGFTVPKSAHVQLFVFDLLGRQVANLVDKRLNAGKHRISWRADGAPSGIYVYRLSTEGLVTSKRMVLLR